MRKYASYAIWMLFTLIFEKIKLKAIRVDSIGIPEVLWRCPVASTFAIFSATATA